MGEDSGEGEIALLFKVVGQGTLWLSQRQKGDKIDILGPLGKGFDIRSTSGDLLLVAGGIGISPLVFLAQRALSSSQHSVTLIHGANTATQLYPQQLLPEEIQFIPVTEDGTMGQKAMATDVLPDFLSWADEVYACGPVDMYRTMALTLNPSPLKGEGKGEGEKRSNLKLKRCQVSLEVRMGCGIGACYCCTINTKNGSKQVCRDGPVFELGEIIWEEVRI
jgi:dihydroorotate dehydrogenase electron transfer subunit